MSSGIWVLPLRSPRRRHPTFACIFGCFHSSALHLVDAILFVAAGR